MQQHKQLIKQKISRNYECLAFSAHLNYDEADKERIEI